MLLVIDTNIIVNAIKSDNPTSKARRLMKDVMRGIHVMCLSQSIMKEYEDVLHRLELKLNTYQVDMFLAFIRLNGVFIEPLPTTNEIAEMKDEDDRKFFDVARCLNVKLVTRNVRDYPVHELITNIEEIYQDT